MELVYLWVEKYKNIKEQGFVFNQNFKYDFEYIKDDHSLMGKLSITQKKTKKLHKLFSPNIQVTAIVGANGTGKSSIFEFILLFLTKEKQIQEKYKGVLVLKNKDGKFIVYSNLNTLTLMNDNIILHHDLKSFAIEEYQKDNPEINNLFESLVVPYFNYSLTYHDILNYVGRLNNEQIKLHFPMIPDKRYGNIDIVESDRSIEKIILNTYKVISDDDKSKIYNDFFKPKYLEVYINYNQIEKENDRLKDDIQKEIIEKIDISKNYFIEKKNKEAIDLIYEILHIKSQPINYKSVNWSSVSPPIGIFNIENKEPVPREINDIQNLTNFQKDSIQSVKNNLATQKIFRFHIDNITHDSIRYLTSLDFPFFDVEIVDENEKKYSSLSFGERQLVALVAQIFWFGTKEYKRTIIREVTPYPPSETSPYHAEGYDTTPFEIDDEIDIPINKYIILLDEIDLSFHPKWQQKTVQYLIDVLRKITDKSFHLILTSHSPFLLSDLPKENVIFLDQYTENDEEVINSSQEVGNCKVVDGLENKDKTFAANIHTLLSNSFFMGSNLMGEFARSKLKEIIKFHSDIENDHTERDIVKEYEEKREEFAYIQQSIGDTYIANIIQNHIDAIERIVYGKEYNDRYKEKEIRKLIEKFSEEEIIKFIGTKDD